MKELLRTNDITVIAYAQALLADDEIPVFEFDQNMSTLEGSLGILPRRLMVADKDFFLAKSILNENGISTS